VAGSKQRGRALRARGKRTEAGLTRRNRSWRECAALRGRGDVCPVSDDELRLAMPWLSPRDLERSFARWSSGGTTKSARQQRRRRAHALAGRLKYLRASVGAGAHGFRRPRVVEVEGRTIALLDDLDAVIVGAIAGGFARHPGLNDLLPSSFGFFGPGARQLVENLCAKASEKARSTGQAKVIAWDLRACFTSLSPFSSLDVMRGLGFGAKRLDALCALYGFWADDSRLRGIPTGPCSSPALAEFGLRSLDRSLSALGEPLRYADNIALVVRDDDSNWPALIEKVLAEFNLAQGATASAHKWSSSRFHAEAGFEVPLSILGFVLRGRSIDVDPRRVDRLAARLDRAGDDAEAAAILSGWRSHYEGLVGGARLDTLQRQLRCPRARRAINLKGGS
jgi:hypothetical protein